MAAAILLVNYRVYDELDAALASLRPALRPDDEVVVFDQASDGRRLAAVAARHAFVRTIAHENNVGFAAGINRAAATTSAPYLMWLNPDTALDGPVLDTLEAWLDAHPETAVVGPRVVDADGAVQASARRFPEWTTALAGRSTWLTRRFPKNWLSARNLRGRDTSEPLPVDWLAGSCLMTRRTVFEQLGGLDERFFLYWEDADYCRRVADAKLGVTVYLPTATVRHWGGRSARLDAASAIRAFHRSAAHLQEKHAGPIGRALSPLVRAALWARGEWLARRRRI